MAFPRHSTEQPWVNRGDFRMHLGLMLAGISAFGMVVCAPAFAQDKPFQGVTVNVITQTGAIQEPLQRRAPEFEQKTGAKINVIAVPFSDLYQKALIGFRGGPAEGDDGRADRLS